MRPATGKTRGQAANVLLSSVSVDGRVLGEKDLVRNGDGAIGAKLGSLTANSKLVVETDYEIQANTMRLLPGQEPALRVEVLSSREVASEPTSSSK